MNKRVLFIFLDGVGLGDEGDHNPFCSAHLPTLTGLLGVTPVRAHAPLRAARAQLHALDATLGVAGLPQSGTGQTALFTGENAVAMHGAHFGPWVPVSLRPLLAERNLLSRAQQAGRSAAFATAYPEEVVNAAEGTRVPAFLRAGPPLVALAAGLLVRHTAELAAGTAVASEITNNGWRDRLHRDVPDITARTAGHNLAAIANAHDLTLFAHYATDTAGHTRLLAPAVAALELVDEFLGGVMERLARDVAVVVASDHGNIEDVRAQHTTNPALGLIVNGPPAELASLLDVTPYVLATLGVA